MARRAKGKFGPRHVRLYHWMLESVAWTSLNANARAIYIEMSKRFMGTNNGRIPYSVREAAASLRIGAATAARALTQLQGLGFIKAVTKGSFGYKKRHATEWLLTEHPNDLGIATKDFMKFGSTPKRAAPPPGKLEVYSW
jgi:hypothetical protein